MFVLSASSELLKSAVYPRPMPPGPTPMLQSGQSSRCVQGLSALAYPPYVLWLSMYLVLVGDSSTSTDKLSSGTPTINHNEYSIRELSDAEPLTRPEGDIRNGSPAKENVFFDKNRAFGFNGLGKADAKENERRIQAVTCKYGGNNNFP